ncbi:hypothetical protein HY478_02615 [Candidatus Uhrbacteria bacterium]|nr:hypothetical protein [Candidatus Uhrbacteria bacterium]
MADRKFFTGIATRYVTYEQAYRTVVRESAVAQNQAKRAIFALHRGDSAEANKLLGSALKVLVGFEPLFKKEPMLRYEGALRAAIEEFLEASFFRQFVLGNELDRVAELSDIDAELYLGGLSDLTGELVRYAVAQATARHFKEVARAKQTLDEVITFLVSLDLTGYLRQKYDQAKNSLRRMEEVAYDVALKGRGR